MVLIVLITMLFLSACGHPKSARVNVPPPPPPESKSEPKPAQPAGVLNSVQSPPLPLVITVSKGDTAAKIAQDLGVTVSDLAEANPGANVLRLKVGQKLKVPRPEAK